MYPITNDLLTRFQNGDKQYVRMTMGSTVIDGSDIMQGSFSINRYVETNESVAVGSVVAAELTCVLNNYDGTYDNTSFIGSEAYVEVGVENSNHVVQYIPMGYFIFDEATRTKNTISLAALDRMAKFDDPIVASSFSFPYTLTNLLSRICTLCSVTKGTFTLTNSSYSVAELPEETKTYRDLLRWICEVSGSNGYISYDGKLYLGWYGTTSQFNILPSNRTQSELDPNTFTITGVTILTGDNNKYTAGTNTRPITITNNPLINTTTAQSVANTLNTKLNGFSYTPFNAVMLPSPMIYPMDRATFTTAEGTTVAVSVTEVTFKLNGNTAIACKGEMTVKGRAYGLADQTFYASNIAAGSITADKIAAGAITADKIQTGAVTSDAINSSVDMATNAGVASTYATKSDAIKREQRLYRRTSTTSTPSTPTSWITTSTDVNNAWTTKPIAYNTTYKYLWVCWQRETVSGTLSCTTPVRDATITVIDGGNIITGTVTADQIYVTDLETLDATIGGWTINETNIASSGNAVVLNSAGTISVTETGTSAEGAKFIAEASTDKAYYSAWGVRVENPPNMGTGNGTKALLQETGLTSETTASGGVFHGVALTDVSRNPVLTLIDRSSSEEWKNQQTEQDIKITHTDKSVSPNVVDKTMQLDKNGLYQANKDGTKDYTAEISPHASTSGGYVSRTRVSASDSSTSSSSYISDTAQTDNSATIAAHAQKTEGNNVTWSSDSTIETTNMNARINLQGYQGSSATLGAYNNLGNAGGSGYETSSLSLETGSTAVTSRNDWATAGLSVTRANNSGSSKLLLRCRLSGTTHTSEITPQTLSVDSHDLLKTTRHLSQSFSTLIAANANLNTTTYTAIGMYYHYDTATVATFTNCPTEEPFAMYVETPINNSEDNTGTWKYRVRHIVTINGIEYIQNCQVRGTEGSWAYGAWKKVQQDEIGTTTVSGKTWNWIKHSDGTAEMWADFTLNGSWITWGSLYVLADTTRYSLPFTLTKKFIDQTMYYASDSSYSSAWAVEYYLTGSSNTQTTVSICRPTSGENNKNYYCRKYIKGTY